MQVLKQITTPIDQLSPLGEAQFHLVQLYSVNIPGVDSDRHERVVGFGHPDAVSS